uniref:M23 family metallopeptidase n=1 Tax=Altererythrobacter segetis TaxID=1104773 RepID=UPI001FAFD28E|nr:M23 family metallopeptidase [Altererythrobacter segetis]
MASRQTIRAFMAAVFTGLLCPTAVLAGSAGAQTARARIVDDPRYSASESLSRPEHEPRGQAETHISAREAQLAGEPRYALRSKIGGAAIVTFTNRPPPPSFEGIEGSPVGLPLAGRLSSTYGLRTHPILGGQRWHRGVDLAAPAGTPIRATSDGTVRKADWSGGYGLMVELDAGGGVQTLYGHMSRVAVSAGQTVRKGDVLGYVGSTGLSTGPHVHYEVRRDGHPVDPNRR